MEGEVVMRFVQFIVNALWRLPGEVVFPEDRAALVIILGWAVVALIVMVSL